MKIIVRVLPYLIGFGVISGFQPLTSAQTIPDNTLGAESSKITNIDQLRERIDGGAIRGSNLFHSFLEFNVGEGRGVYFSNPAGIANILSRVTGGNASHILGQLGVLGGANLFLLNPNGIIFGANASLDIQGSFFATTADGIKLGENGFFSATELHKSNLLSVNPGVLFFNQAANHPGTIINRGNLAVGGDLNFTAGNLDLQGQLYSGGNLTLKGLNTVQLRDTVTNPFVAAAMGNLLIQGNQNVDIFVLNHPNSGLFSGGDLVLRSANKVVGDAHYWSGGDFKIEKLDGSLGELLSIDDPVIRSLGDVSFDSYIGASLHIIAGGKVEIPGSIIITEPDLFEGLSETINLSNGETLSIDGFSEPTLDIRAGVDSSAIGMPVEKIGTGIFIPLISSTTNPTSAEIIIGDVMISDALLGTGGKVFLTNQYFPNNSLSGNIIVNSINSQDFFSGGSIVIDSRSNIKVDGMINTTSFFGQGGNIQLLADSDTILNSNISTGGGQIQLTAGNNIILKGSNIFTDNLFTGSRGDIKIKSGSLSLRDGSILSTSPIFFVNSISLEKEGNITIETQQLIIEDGSQITTGTFNEKDAGDITIFASDSVQIKGGNINSGTFDRGNGGNISIQTQKLIVQDRGNISASSDGDGRSGNISIKNMDSIHISNDSRIQSQANSIGEGGDINIKTRNLTLQDTSAISVATLGNAKAGAVIIDASRLVEVLGGSGIQSSTFGSQSAGNIQIKTEQLVVQDSNSFISTLTDGSGNAGILTLDIGKLLIQNGGIISTETDDAGNAGNLFIQASDSVIVNGQGDAGISLTTRVNERATGKGGDLRITTGQLIIQNGAQIAAGTFGDGDSGKLTVTADSVELRDMGSGLFTQTEGKGNSNDLMIQTRQLLVENGAQISASTISQGEAGILSVTASDSIELRGSNSGLFVKTEGSGNAGDVIVTTRQFIASDGAKVSATNEGTGNAGEINLNATQKIQLNNSQINSTVEEGATGNSRQITLNTPNLTLNNSEISAATAGEGNAGSITVEDAQTVSLDNSTISTAITPTGIATQPSNITLNTQQLTLNNNSQITASTQGKGDAGSINLPNAQTITLNNSEITASTSGEGDTGEINLNADQKLQLNNSQINSAVEQNARGNSRQITLNTPNLNLNNSEISAASAGQGNAGSIIVPNAQTVNLDNSTISTAIAPTGTATQPSNITLNTRQLTLNNNSQITASTSGKGDAGAINVSNAQNITLNQSEITASTAKEGDTGVIDLNASNTIELTNNSEISSSVEQGAVGNSRQITLNTPNLNLNNSEISAATAGQGNAGSIIVPNAQTVSLNNSTISTAIAPTGKATQPSNITLNTRQLTLNNNAQITASTQGTGDAGSITVTNTDKVSLNNNSQISASTSGKGDAGDISINAQTVTLNNNSAITTTVNPNAIGQGGDITIETSGNSVTLNNRSQISSRSEGQGDAGNITINSRGQVTLNNSDISTSSDLASGGEINIQASNIRLRGDSNIRTNVNSGVGGGGNITLSANFILAFDDSDILAFARDGKGGNIILNTPIFFGDGFQSVSSRINPDNLDGNNRVDINASGAISGSIVIPDLTFIRNSLTELPENIIDTESLIANSCVVPNRSQTGTFIITGSGGLPVRPGDVSSSTYSTGEVRTLEDNNNNEYWQPGDSIIEPQGVYRLPNGKLVLSRECESAK